MKVKILRLGDNGKASIGALYINGILRCGDVADEERDKKILGETRVPDGIAFLGLRREGGFHYRYLKKYGSKFHKGMICVYTHDNWILKLGGMIFKYVLFHKGNTEKDTGACVLPNYVLNFKNYTGQRSADAYEEIYPEIAQAIIDWENDNTCERPTIEYIDVETGK